MASIPRAVSQKEADSPFLSRSQLQLTSQFAMWAAWPHPSSVLGFWLVWSCASLGHKTTVAVDLSVQQETGRQMWQGDYGRSYTKFSQNEIKICILRKRSERPASCPWAWAGLKHKPAWHCSPAAWWANTWWRNGRERETEWAMWCGESRNWGHEGGEEEADMSVLCCSLEPRWCPGLGWCGIPLWMLWAYFITIG